MVERGIDGRARAALGWIVLVSLSWTAAGAVEAPRVKPDSATPASAQQFDVERLKTVKDLVARRKYAEARAIGRLMKDPAAASLAEWYYFDAEDPLVSVPEIDAFLDAHPEWPSVGKIQTHAEKRMTWTMSASAILDFYESRDPITGEGKVQLARAQFQTGSTDAGVLHVRDAWIHNNFVLADEQRLLAQYGGRLTPDDHAARVDRLLWAREVATARRAIGYLRPEAKRLANTRAALLLGGADGPKLYNALSAEERADSGVMLAAVRHYRRAEEEPRAIAIARQAPTDAKTLRDPSRWWDEQQLLMRWALKNRVYADAYAMASHHGLAPGSADFAEAEFNAGWIALRFLNEPGRAEKHFAALTASVSAPISLSRGWYWLARAAEAQDRTEIAKLRYGKAAEHIYTFYGQLAAEEIGGAPLMRTFETTDPATPEEKARFGSRPAVAALRMLADAKDDRAFLIFAYHIDDQLQSRGEFRELADLAMRIKAPHVAVRAGKVAVRAGAFAPDIAYPPIDVPREAKRFVAPEMTLAISRQESEFNPRAFSRAGARGMMQLIPSTAQVTARKEGLAYRQAALLDDPHYNMILGSAHLSHLLERYGGSNIMTFAAYNAGPNRVTQWAEAYGDPRSPALDPLDWIEQIPFEETRNYVQRVFENMQVYRSRLGASPIAGALVRDIERGGGTGRLAATSALSAPGVIPDVQPRIASLAEPLLNPVVANADAVPHVRLKPQPKTAAALDGDTKRTQARSSGSRRQGFRLRREEPRPALPPPAHDDKSNASGTASSTTSSVTQIAPEKTAAPAMAPLSMEPVDGPSPDVQAADESVYAKDGLLPEANAEAHVGAEAITTADDTCVTYSDFIAETAREEASAADLNAGALAELQGGGTSCPTEASAEVGSN
jgi:soluble lytic murein transglycosylase